jgi:hypothetical protein
VGNLINRGDRLCLTGSQSQGPTVEPCGHNLNNPASDVLRRTCAVRMIKTQERGIGRDPSPEVSGDERAPTIRHSRRTAPGDAL